MPYRDGVYHLPEHRHAVVPDPMSTCHSRLRIYLWNVLAFRHDREPEKEAEWLAKAREAARELGVWLDRRERAAAIGAAASAAKQDFAQDLAEEGTPFDVPRCLWDGESAPVHEWRSRKGREPLFR